MAAACGELDVVGGLGAAQGGSVRGRAMITTDRKVPFPQDLRARTNRLEGSAMHMNDVGVERLWSTV
ncbi:MAG: hypothetical protein JNL62_15865 [Bryobacterales bacterium]|nr:hypothetical protein [Bryobacterales bacterium]